MQMHARTLTLVLTIGLGALALGQPVAGAVVPAREHTAPPNFDPFADPGRDHGLNDVSALSPTDVWAVGTHSGVGSTSVTWIRHYDGTKWRHVPSPSPGTQTNLLRSVASISSTDVWAVGGQANVGDSDEHPLVEHWDGTSWTVVDTPAVTGRGYSVSASGPNDVWIVGDRYQNPIAEHWDGTTWTETVLEVPAVNPPYHVTLMIPYDVLALSSHNAWLVGTYDAQNSTGGYQREILGEHWDGSAWHVVAVPRGSAWTYPTEIKATSAHDIWAVGYTEYREHAYIAHYDGHTWTSTTQPLYEGKRAFLTGVTALAPDDVWAVGFHGDNDHGVNRYHPFAEHWDGSQWTLDESIDLDLGFATMAAIGSAGPDDVFAVGGLDAHEKTRALTERWDGSSWQRMP